MKSFLSSWGPRVIAPLCFCLSPLIYTFAESEYDWHVGDLFESLLWFAFGTGILFVLLYFILSGLFTGRSGRCRLELTGLFLTILILLLFTLYGPIRACIEDAIGGGFPLAGILGKRFIVGPDKILFSVCAGIFAGIFFAVRNAVEKVPAINRFFLVSGIIFFCIGLTQAALHHHKPLAVSDFTPPADKQSATDLPNIYYIILDSYSRDDVLLKYYGFDNGAFLNFLKSRRFYVAKRSRCNYPMTLLSLKASLCMKYFPAYNTLSDKRYVAQFKGDIQQSLVAKILMTKGYNYIPIGQFLYYEPFPRTRQTVIATGYQITTPMWFRQLLHTPLEYALVHFFSHEVPKRIRHNVFRTMEIMDQAIEFTGRKFVFLHFLPPHQPYIFAADGSMSGHIAFKPTIPDKRRYIEIRRRKYLEQLQFATRVAKGAIEKIIASDSGAIIVLQSDHGEWTVDTLPKNHYFGNDTNYSAERMPILNAYRVPPPMEARLYDSISPVNTFRLILSGLGISKEPLLPDSHFVVW